MKKQLQRLQDLQKDVSKKIKWRLKFLLPEKQARFTDNNQIAIYHDGSQAFRAMWDAIGSAKKRVWLETFILDPDYVGTTTIDLLLEAHGRGCEIALLYDYLGSARLYPYHLKRLYDAKIPVVAFHPLIGSFRPVGKWQWPLYRTHRKILCVDDDIAFCGGMNVSDDYAGTLGNNRFRDTHCRVVGPAALDVQEVFLRSMHAASFAVWKEMEDQYRKTVEQTGRTIHTPPTGVKVQILESDVRNNKRQIQKSINGALSQAKRYCYITSPYFLPPKKLKNSLIHCASRGVDVAIITQGICTTPVINQASRYISGYFIDHGIKIYQLENQELHAKTIVIDGDYSTIGTFNFDSLSYNHLLEINIAILDEGIATQMEHQFQNDLKNCRLLTRESLDNRSVFTKFYHWCCYYMALIACR